MRAMIIAPMFESVVNNVFSGRYFKEKIENANYSRNANYDSYDEIFNCKKSGIPSQNAISNSAPTLIFLDFA